MTWREHYAPKIAAIIKENVGKNVKELRIILYKANPGQYGHMKKIWSDESLKQLGLKQLGLKKRKERVGKTGFSYDNPAQTKLL